MIRRVGEVKEKKIIRNDRKRNKLKAYTDVLIFLIVMDRAADSQNRYALRSIIFKIFNFHGPKSIHHSASVDYFRRGEKMCVCVYSFVLVYPILACVFLFVWCKEKKFYGRETVAGRSWWNCCVRDGLTQSPSKKKKKKKEEKIKTNWGKRV